MMLTCQLDSLPVPSPEPPTSFVKEEIGPSQHPTGMVAPDAVKWHKSSWERTCSCIRDELSSRSCGTLFSSQLLRELRQEDCKYKDYTDQ